METNKKGVTHVPAGEGKKTVWMVGTDLITFKATGEDTDGAYALFDSLILPQGGPPPHIHHREGEAWYVLEGEFEFLNNDHWIKASAGSFVYAPKGSLHTLKCVGEEPGRLLTLVTPAGFEKFFEELGVPGTDVSDPPPFGPAEIEKLLTTAPKYGLEMPPPPGR